MGGLSKLDQVVAAAPPGEKSWIFLHLAGAVAAGGFEVIGGWAADDPAPRGNGLALDAAGELVTVAADGIYDIGFHVDEGTTVGLQVYVVINDDSIGPAYYTVIRATGGMFLPGIALDAGDTIGLGVGATSGDIGDTQLYVVER